MHKAHCPRVSPLSGFEPPYEPRRWNDKKEIRETHNCFAYAMNIHDPKQIRACRENKYCNVPFHQPGAVSGYPRFRETRKKTCPDMMARIFGDNPSIQPTTFTGQCPRYTSKIAIVVDADEDYHFYRQDSNGMWSHKPGGMPVTNKDALGRPIYDPALASRDYRHDNSTLNYDQFCSYMCVPRVVALYLKIGGRRWQTRRLRGTSK